MELRRQLEKLKLNLLFLLSITIKLASTVGSLGENLSVRITASPDPQLETVCIGRKIILTCDTNPPAGPSDLKISCAWTFGGDIQYEDIEGNTCTIDVVVKPIPVTYKCTCMATNLNLTLGSDTITISANAHRPIIKIDGPSSYTIPPNEGSNLTIASTITSHIILTEFPSWRMNGGDLHPNAKEEYKSTDEMTYISSLHIYNCSSDDNGNYTLSVSNTCGTSSKSVYISTNNDPYHGHSTISGKLQKGLIIGSVVGTIVVLMLISLFCFCRYWKKRKNEGKNCKNHESLKSSALTPVGTSEDQSSLDYGAIENTQRGYEKWKEALVDHSDKLCSRLTPVVTDLVIKLGTTLSERTRSRVKTDRYLSDYEKVEVVINSIENRQEFDKFCSILEELNHKSLADTLKSAASD